MDISLLAELRRRIRDVRYSHRAFGLAISPSSATSAYLEVTNNRLIVTCAGGDVPSLDLDLTSQRYETIGKLHQVLSRAEGYLVQLDEDCNTYHLSADLESFGPLDILGTGVDLKHHLFADSELESILQDAIRRHNPTFNMATLPPGETAFVLQLAEANVCRIQAIDVSKRVGVDADVTALLKIAESLEKAYSEDTTRLRRAIASPKEASPNVMGEGDVVLGHIFKRSLRTGMMSPLSQNLPPTTPVILEPTDQDIEDDNVRVNWQRNRDVDFYSYELWMDSRPDVIRIREGLIFTSTPFSFLSNDASLRSASERVSSAKLVFRSFGANSNFDTAAFATFVEEFGQMIRSFIVGNLEPEMDYYFRLYVVDLNYETANSNVIKIRTKALRCKFLQDNFISVSSGPTGTLSDVYFKTDRGAYTIRHQLKVGEAIITPTIITPYHIRFTFPNFVNKNIFRDLTVISPNGLIDNKRNAVMVTG